ncbi:ABC transporter ATP-binding protein [Glutamicibacter endophyticus]|uniref:ABC transporter ATP-binding protein n=1 Tax=Glutamicibacter endophyticus TaxID=1522174 RepID=UPI003AEF66A2
MHKALELRDYTLRRADGAALLQGVNLTLRPGELLALVGRSGSGKTLITRALTGLTSPQLHAQGQLLLDGERLDNAAPQTLRALRGARIGMLFQQPKRVLNPRLSIAAHLYEALGAFGPARRAAASRRIPELLAEAGLKDPHRVARMRPGQLSGGMAQRAMVAIALAADPDYLLADEPTASLDSVLKHEVLELLRSRQRERGLGVLLITHDLASVRSLADRIAVLEHGHLAESGPATGLLDTPEHRATRELLEASLHPVAGTAPATGAPVLEAQAVEGRYRGAKRADPALWPTTLTLHRGEVLGVVGQSGSGKSTFARLLAGLQKPSAGSVRRSHGAEAPNAVQLISQEPAASFDRRLTLRESLSAAVHRLPSAQANELIDRAVARVGLDVALCDRRPGTCSGGQLQRMSIARALLAEPRVLICDESTSALDTVAQRHILDLLLQLRTELGLSLVIISHDMQVVGHMADNVAVFGQGRLLEHRPAAELFATPHHEQTRALLAARQPVGAAG